MFCLHIHVLLLFDASQRQLKTLQFSVEKLLRQIPLMCFFFLFAVAIAFQLSLSLSFYCARSGFFFFNCVCLHLMIFFWYILPHKDKAVISKLEQDVDFQLTLSLLPNAKDSSIQVSKLISLV